MLFVTCVCPILIGMALRARWPVAARRVERPANAIGVGAAARALRCGAAERVALAIRCSCRQFAMAALVALTILRAPPVLVPATTYTLISCATAAMIVVLTRRGAVARASARPESPAPAMPAPAARA